jgi:transposase
MGSEPSEVLEWEPGGFVVEVTERRKYACGRCQSGLVIGPAPDRVLDGAMPGPGLLAEVVVRKVKDHCPLERQSRIFGERFGVPLCASTLGEWLAGAAEVLAPLAARLREQGLRSRHLSLDDTPVRVLDPAHEKGVKRGHLWSFVSDAPLCFYLYTPSWSGGPIQELLGDYQGTLQSDGYAGLDPLYRKEMAPKRAGCLAHARRKFVQALEAGDLRAAAPLHWMQKLYAVERQAKREGLDAAGRHKLRQTASVPLMEKLHAELLSLGAQAPPKTPLGQAITYALRQWPTLQVFLWDGAQPIDNNHTERTLRPIAVGRKNWLFAGSDEGARRLAILYTLVQSSALCGISDPWHYLRDVLQKLSRGWPQSRLDELLPLAWHATHPPT